MALYFFVGIIAALWTGFGLGVAAAFMIDRGGK